VHYWADLQHSAEREMSASACTRSMPGYNSLQKPVQTTWNCHANELTADIFYAIVDITLTTIHLREA